ncbi:MAG: C_GCAxxG_C_C family protein [Alphaproteobacteria bacterium]|nr:C_GCAxxG_C_C family protein [Alphaproteobacteria bacterium]
MTSSESRDAGAEAGEHFRQGLYCAESVLLAIAHHLDIESDLLPAVATGFCGGTSRTGGVMGLGLAFGRNAAGEAVDQAYRATQALLDRFTAEFGSTNCGALLGCDLGTPEGRAEFNARGLHERCLRFTVRATELCVELMEPPPANPKP